MNKSMKNLAAWKKENPIFLRLWFRLTPDQQIKAYDWYIQYSHQLLKVIKK